MKYDSLCNGLRIFSWHSVDIPLFLLTQGTYCHEAVLTALIFSRHLTSGRRQKFPKRRRASAAVCQRRSPALGQLSHSLGAGRRCHRAAYSAGRRRLPPEPGLAATSPAEEAPRRAGEQSRSRAIHRAGHSFRPPWNRTAADGSLNQTMNAALGRTPDYNSEGNDSSVMHYRRQWRPEPMRAVIWMRRRMSSLFIEVANSSILVNMLYASLREIPQRYAFNDAYVTYRCERRYYTFLNDDST